MQTSQQTDNQENGRRHLTLLLLALIYVLRELEGISEFKIVQETKSFTKVQLVTDTGQLSDTMSEKIIGDFKKRLGEQVTIEIETVTKIEAEKSGKFRYVISKVEA